jgi:hypothetical protein
VPLAFGNTQNYISAMEYLAYKKNDFYKVLQKAPIRLLKYTRRRNLQ